MKYFIDTEFIEGFHKPLFGKKRHFIDLISIGIVCEDGREYYAISNEFDSKDADKWVNENVISKLESKYKNFETGRFDFLGGEIIGEVELWKSNKQIAEDIIHFVNDFGEESKSYLHPEFYAYYADYDWVLFCSLFGRMIDLPKRFPMYCNDLKQTLDQCAKKYIMQVENKVEGVTRQETSLNMIKSWEKYPKQTNEHNALADAKWNYELYKFLHTI